MEEKYLFSIEDGQVKGFEEIIKNTTPKLMEKGRNKTKGKDNHKQLNFQDKKCGVSLGEKPNIIRREEDSGEISDCSEKLEEENHNNRIIRIFNWKGGNYRKRLDGLAEELGFWVIDHWDVPEIVVHNKSKYFIKEPEIRKVPHIDEDMMGEGESEWPVQGSLIVGDEGVIIRNSQLEFLTEDIIQSIRSSNSSEIMFFNHSYKEEWAK